MGGRASIVVGLWCSRWGAGLLVFLGMIAFLLTYEHRAHIPGDYWLLVGLVTVCLGMHFFLHGGRGGHDGHSGGSYAGSGNDKTDRDSQRTQ